MTISKTLALSISISISVAVTGCGDDSDGTDTPPPVDSGGVDSGRADGGSLDAGDVDAGPTIDLMGYDIRLDPADSYERVDRMGMPAVSTVLARSEPLMTDDTDAYNDLDPAEDSTFTATLVANLTALHTALDAELGTLNLAVCDPAGTPGCTGQEVAPGVTVASLIIPDTVTIDTSADASTASFPNGRRLPEPVMDITLSIVLLDLTSTDGCGGGQCTAAQLIGTNPPANDLTFGTEFPYLAAAHPAP